jgi:EAL domain-containing protein (putative c-di-GMP-specific phosphodiesterase class I)
MRSARATRSDGNVKKKQKHRETALYFIPPLKTSGNRFSDRSVEACCCLQRWHDPTLSPLTPDLSFQGAEQPRSFEGARTQRHLYIIYLPFSHSLQTG